MTAVLARLRSDVRGGWRSWAVLALLVGVFSGVVLTAAVGARRTATAYPRFLQAVLAEDLLMSPANTGIGSYYEVLGDHPDVATIGVIGGAALFPRNKAGHPEFTANVFMPVDGRFLYEVDRPLLLDGRRPRLDAPREVLVNPLAADRYDLEPGDRLEMAALSVPAGQPDDAEPEASPLTVTVVGIGVIPPDIVPTAKLDNQPTFVTSPAFYRTFVPDTVGLGYDGAAIRLRPGTNVTQFRQEAQALATSFEEVGGEIFVGEQTDRTAKVTRAIRPQAAALAIFAALAGLAGFLVLGQAMARQLALDATEVPILRTLGLTQGQLTLLTMLRALVVAVSAAVVAVVTAVALSPLTPIGAARRAERDPGVEVNVAWLAGGALVVLTLFVARATVPARRLARARAGLHGAAELEGGQRLSVLARLGRAAGLPPAAAAGVRMALEPGHGRTAVPVRATLAGAIIGLAAFTTAVTFAVSLDRLVATPRLYGRTWDVVIDGQFSAIPRSQVEPALRSNADVEGFSGGYYGEARIGGRGVTAIGLHDPRVGPSLVEGRAPRSDDEIVLGTTTLRSIDRQVGDVVTVTLNKVQRDMRVVGRAVFPGLGRGGFPQTGLGEGVWATAEAVEPPPDPQAGGEPSANFWLIRTRPGTDLDQLALDARFAEACGLDCLSPEDAVALQQPAEIATLARVRWTPVLLAAVLAGLAVATLGQSLVSSIRRRRRDLAVLKTLGFLRSQVSATVAWQSTTMALLATVFGVPIGIITGRLAWRLLGEQLGIVPEPGMPTMLLFLALPVTILAANLLAVVPGWLAARIRPGVALRTE